MEKMVVTHRLKAPQVEAWRFLKANMPWHPSWVVEALKDGRLYWQGGQLPYFTVPAAISGEKEDRHCPDGSWLVRKLDGRIKVYSDYDFRTRFEPL